MADYTQAIKLNPNLADAYRNRRFVYFRIGDVNKVREDIQRAAQLFRNQSNTAGYEQAIRLLNSL